MTELCYPVHMSTGLQSQKNNKIKNLNRFAELAKLGEVAFHTSDLANLWHITNRNTLYTTIKRYVQHGLFFPIHKGFYSIKEPKTLDAQLLGTKALRGNVYVSTETVLVEEGIITQRIPAITLVSGQSKQFSIAGHSYQSRQLSDLFLYQAKGIVTMANGVRKATKERAIADLLYFNPHAYFDAVQFIDWKAVRALQAELGYPLTPKRYD